MKVIPVEEAVGTVLCHDITRIVPGECKGPAFRRGHIVGPEDIQALLDIGKANLYVFDPKDGYVHEDECALRLARAAAGQGLTLSSPSEGKVTLTARHDGVLTINVPALFELNSITDVTFGTIHTGQFVAAGRAVGGTRVIPLAVPEELLCEAEAVCQACAPLIEVRPLRPARVGIVTTGSEVFTGRIKDGFGPILSKKFSSLGSAVVDQVFVSDQVSMTAHAITDLVQRGADFIAVTGGMSVDPDDQTPAAIRATGAEVISYGAPTYPGAMFMLAYLGDVPVVGLPGCVMYYKASIFDLVVPRLLTGERLTRKDIVAFGHGGLCESCPSCHYPACGFGKL
ncbi:MAG: molybdopterin-binding protein [Desulfovibrionales bacterium]|nr:molybdopterin-binding protein [Desulfovibrionales bacterium]